MADIHSEEAALVDQQSIPDVQGCEIAEVVRTIQHTGQGQQQLQQIFTETDQSGDGRGELFKKIWDRDVTDIKIFFKDQKNNGELISCLSSVPCATLFLFF